MPEMPEVQAHAERMTKALAGSTLAKFQLLNFAGLKTFDPPADAAVGNKLVAVERRAKYLIFRFEDDLRHVVHLMQGGRLKPDAKQSRKPRGGIARWVFSDVPPDAEEAWLLTEAGTERKAGVWAVRGDPDDQEPLAGLGPEADGLTAEELAAVLSGQSRRVHGVLRSQKVIAGLGRMLANEIIFEAGLSPFANASKLDSTQVERLHEALQTVVAAATAHERTLDHIGKSADRPSKVHNRAGEPCLGTEREPCEDSVRSVEYRRYTVYYCPTHQTGGKILADNTTSKFLK